MIDDGALWTVILGCLIAILVVLGVAALITVMTWLVELLIKFFHWLQRR